mgnify:CR=1 FL=1
MSITRTLLTFILAACSTVAAAQSPNNDPDRRPNIVWVIVDDMSANFSCYGEKTIATPNVDRLAAEGTLFRNAFVTAPVCSDRKSTRLNSSH